MAKTTVKWKEDGITVAGGNGCGLAMSQLAYPRALFVDEHQLVYVVDWGNQRIVEWKTNSRKGRTVAGGNGRGKRKNQLDHPRDVLIDKHKHAVIISDRKNRRVTRWSLENKTEHEVIVDDVDCWGIAMDAKGALYVVDSEQSEVRRWEEGNKQGTLVAGGNKPGNKLNQLHGPTSVCVDEDESLYISDYCNHRVIKWAKGASEGIVVAGGQGKGDGLNQLACPEGVAVDRSGRVYVVDCANHRVVCWSQEDDEKGEIVVGKKGAGREANQLLFPNGLCFDAEGHLYVADCDNHRIQKFEVDGD